MSVDKHPNVVIVITDDQGYGDLGCHGNPVAYTPEMDRLHDEGVRLVDFHSSPMCTPTRGQLLTGLDALRNGAVNVSSGRTMLRADVPTMADVFKRGGYRTGLFGKWHLGDNYPYRPQDRGFDESLWFPSSHISSLPDYWENDYFDDVYCRNGQRQRYQGYCTDVFFREAMVWMQERIDADERFLTFLPANAPHYPWFVPQEDRELLERKFAEGADQLPPLDDEMRANLISFLSMIYNVDNRIGDLREFLRKNDIERNTILIFMTDNGSTFGPVYYNAGMQGGKTTLWEGGHRVPCFVYWPDGDLGEPRDIHGLMHVQDLLPTLAEFCGLEFPEAPTSDGVSLASALTGSGAPPDDRMLFINYSRMPSTDFPTPDAGSVIREDEGAVCWRRWRLLEGNALYDLDSDPAQQVNVIDEHPDVAAKMLDAMEAWWVEVEPIANQVQRVIIGNDEENPMMLSACEWRDVFVDQQCQVRRAERKNSYWDLTVDQPGRYRFELRRWPRESGLSLREACSETQLVDGVYEEGLFMPIASARMMIARETYVQQLDADADSAVFEVQLAEGQTLLHTWFYDDAGQPLCGAYYVYVERLNPIDA